MKEFWLAILKNVITYVLMIIIIIVGGLSITTQKFPPNWAQVVSAVNTLKDGYVSMINLRQQIGSQTNGLKALQGLPSAEDMEAQMANSSNTTPLTKNTKNLADPEIETTLALLKTMSQQMNPQPKLNEAPAHQIDPETKKYLMTLEKQNQDMIEKMDKIQTYLAGLHHYFAQLVPRQPPHQSAVQQPPQTRAVASPQQGTDSKLDSSK